MNVCPSCSESFSVGQNYWPWFIGQVYYCSEECTKRAHLDTRSVAGR